MALETLINTYGYLAILAGTFLEGETVLVLGGFAANRGYLQLPWVMVAAFVGSLCGDQLFFFLGRWQSRRVLARHPSWRGRVEKAQRLLGRFGTVLILSFRFLYGLRTVAPFVIGMSHVPVARFMFLNAVGALVWAVSVAGGGYLFGSALEVLIGDIKHYERQALAAIGIVGLCVWSVYFWRSRRKKRLPD